ncbi:ANTAR domain-containing protein [Amycolatopsis carbonis]|uniref:ANTAR domain-containing protein n=1 Tax=Amycolatopsis carbonis TaxID=715471 RepID=A0A9Y2ISH0_9PSEU|nr:ANTAR domain-containing protein [Amycolatopsis sp. 2-15]WIX83973.1 ANTAR domain-containing protein [Amycolatopsis sp. 2-15]
MLMLLRNWSADEAFDALRKASQHTNFKRHDRRNRFRGRRQPSRADTLRPHHSAVRAGRDPPLPPRPGIRGARRIARVEASALLTALSMFECRQASTSSIPVLPEPRLMPIKSWSCSCALNSVVIHGWRLCVPPPSMESNPARRAQPRSLAPPAPFACGWCVEK